MDVKEVGWIGMNRVSQAQDADRWLALVNAVVNFRVS
jgi:hypothetical protein